MKALVLVFAAWTLTLAPLHAQGCKDKRKAMHSARKALRECNKAWVDSLRVEADPTDDCSAKQAAFITGVKEMKACLKEEKAP